MRCKAPAHRRHSGPGLGADPARFEGFFIYRAERRLVVCAIFRSSRKNTLPNYADVQRLDHRRFHHGAGRTGRLAGQRAKAGKWSRTKSRSSARSDDTYPLQKKGTHARVLARDRASSSALESFRLRLSRAQPAGLCHSPIFSGTRFRLRAHADHYRQRLRRRGRIVSGHDDRCRRIRRERRTARSITRKDFFARPTYLTVSGQLEAEAFACALVEGLHLRSDFPGGEFEHFAARERVLDDRAGDGVLRSERRHGSGRGDCEISRSRYSRNIARRNWSCSPSSSTRNCCARLDFVVERPFQRITYTDAVDLLKKSGEKFEFPVEYGLNLQSEHERWLTEKHFKCPVTVFNYPKEIKPFYMRLNDDGKTVTAMDLLVPGIGEIVGGSQREERLDVLEENMRRHKMDPADYKWYSRSAPLRHGAARRVRPGFRADADVRHRRLEHSRRDSFRAHARQRGVLNRPDCRASAAADANSFRSPSHRDGLQFPFRVRRCVF